MSLFKKLIQDAEKLPKPSEQVFEEIHANKDAIVEDLNNHLHRSKKLQRYAKDNSNNVDIINHNNLFTFLESFSSKWKPELLVRSTLWVYKSYRKSGFDKKYWKIFYKAYFKSTKANISKESFNELQSFYAWIRRNHGTFMELSAEDK